MTYKELLEMLSKLNQEQLNQTVTMHHHFSDEYYPVSQCGIVCDTDVLDENHFVLMVN
jgi:hypothetical protein